MRGLCPAVPVNMKCWFWIFRDYYLCWLWVKHRVTAIESWNALSKTCFKKIGLRMRKTIKNIEYVRSITYFILKRDCMIVYLLFLVRYRPVSFSLATNQVTKLVSWFIGCLLSCVVAVLLEWTKCLCTWTSSHISFRWEPSWTWTQQNIQAEK